MFRQRTGLALAACVLLLAACGPSNKVSVTMTDFHFSPENWTVAAGSTVTVRAVNKGTLEHKWVVMKLGTTASPPFNDDDKPNVLYELDVPAGQTVSDTFTAPSEPGEYEVVCSILGHLEQGMKATLTVK
jgi:plastocyanin